jgi:hypothetical protein
VSVTPRGCISHPVTFRMAEIFRTESILLDVAEVSLPFNAILGRPTLYQFMAVANYGYLVLKMPSPTGVLKIRGNRDPGACEAAEEPGGQDHTPLSSRQCSSVLAPDVQPSGKEDIPVKTVQVGTEAGQTTCVSGDLDSK